jgi:hypothetical protein
MKFDGPAIEHLCKLGAAILPERRPYVILASRAEIDGELTAGRNWDGIAARATAAQTREFRRKYDLQRDEAVIAIDPDAVRTGEELNGLFVHELAHVAKTAPTLLERVSPPPVLTAEQEREAAHKFVEACAGVQIPPWHGDHGDTFLRRAIHLMHRAVEAGYWLDPTDVYSDYGVSPIYDYMAALGDEPERMMGWPMSRIEATAPPAAFCELWAADTTKWEKLVWQ